ncbi:MAG: glycosyl hydrolase 53 family protein [Candidatus Heimdallarchaeota archaeon]
MKRVNFDFTAEWFRLVLILFGGLLIGGIMFLFNSLTGFFTAFIFIIQVMVVVVFCLWYLRLIFAYTKELRKKDPEKKVGVPLGWSIAGLSISLINFIVWIGLSILMYNFPKVVFFVPTALAMVQILHIFIKSKRRNLKDWFLLLYNVFSFLYLFIWMLFDFGVDMPSVLGVVSHTITSDVMWWQLFFVNTGAFFSPTFIFPPYLLNPRYYFAQPVSEYLAEKKAFDEEREDSKENTETEKQIEGAKIDESKQEKKLPGERKPFFEERQKQREIDEEVTALEKEVSRMNIDKDTQHAEHIGSSDISFSTRQIIARFDALLRTFSLSVILILIVLTPLMFAGNISMNVSPAYHKLDYAQKPGMVIAVDGSVFSSYDFEGNFSYYWNTELTNEIDLAKELHATHLRYNIKSRVLNNTLSKQILDSGITMIKNQGLKIILTVSGALFLQKKDLIDNIYSDAITLAQDYQPDYMVVYNEINGELLNNINEIATIDDWLPAIANVTNKIKSLSPTTKVVSSMLATKNGLSDFQTMLAYNTSLDVISVSYYPIFFGWRFNLLKEYSTLFHQESSGKKFWIGETGMETLNYGEDAQSRYLAKVLDLATKTTELNADGVCIKSLIDNHGYTAERGVISHMGLVYFNGKTKKSFDAVKYAAEVIFSIT